ncbi:M20/M25/M40 family metallo-hydrolase [Candidatus Saccharibacteria bacterium]|nr:M20/M25/M40 family metallo-hydrolase [Candidatus Saccharibacteria bacterium]
MSTNQEKNLGHARELMGIMVSNSQRPGGGNLDFINAVDDYLQSFNCQMIRIPDPDASNKSLLVANFGDPDGRQVLAALNHSDVVGVNIDEWQTNPWELCEQGNTWLGRGVCDTHGSGVAMLLAANSISGELEKTNKRISIIFTYDEEAAEQDLSYRGAKLAIGQLGAVSVIESGIFVVGEPTEKNGKIRAMVAQKGRWLANYRIEVDHPGHVSDNVQNALAVAMGVGSNINQYARNLKLGSSSDEEARIFDPPHSTIQISAGVVKTDNYSSTPKSASFSVDMRTLPIPGVHEQRIREVADLILNGYQLEEGECVTLEVLSDEGGSMTSLDSKIAKISEKATGQPVAGFNGGDEGFILRNAGLEGVTMGPGELSMAHKPNEEISIQSVLGAVQMYKFLFEKVMENG